MSKVYITIQTRLDNGESIAQISSSKSWSDIQHKTREGEGTHILHQFEVTDIHVQELWFVTHPDRLDI